MNSFGRLFKVSIFGESHGLQIGVVIDGVPAGIALAQDDLAADICRRKSGAPGTTPRIEADFPLIVSGVFNGITTGAPLTILFDNENTHSSDYELFAKLPRPGHADYVASVKFGGHNDPRGGGHFSGRITLPIVAAGVVAKKIIATKLGGQFSVSASLVEMGGETDKLKWDELLKTISKEGDSLGGVVECKADGLPIGLGEPFFDSVESLISHAVFSIPGVRGVEFGDGFCAARMKGSEHNDPIGPHCVPLKNGSGGINGGLTNGNQVAFRVAFKPTSSIRKEQTTFDLSDGKMASLTVPGRHDVCFALRTPVIVEAMTAIVFADLLKTN